METAIDVLRVASPIMTVVLGAIAIGISWRFYRAGREAQREVHEATEAVKAKMDLLRSNLIASASITAYFYAALANIHIQSRLRRQNADPNPRLVSLLEQSYIDFTHLDGVLQEDSTELDRMKDLYRMAKKFRRVVRSWETYHAMDKKKSGQFELPE